MATSSGRAARAIPRVANGAPATGRRWRPNSCWKAKPRTLTRRAIELALEGDTTALKLCLERIVPQRKSRAVSFDLPPIERAEDLAGAIGSVLQEASCVRLLLDEAAALVGMMESKRKAMETIDLENRLQALERKARALTEWANEDQPG